MSLALPSDWIITRYLDIPLVSPDALDEVMTYELQRHIPFDIGSVLFNYRIAGMINGIYRIIIIFVVKDKIQLLNEALSKIGVSIGNIGISYLYALNLISYNRNKTKFFTHTLGRIKHFKLKDKQEGESVFYFSWGRLIFWITINGIPIVQHILPYSGINDIQDIWTDFLSDVIEQNSSLTTINQIILFGDVPSGLSEYMTTTTKYKVNHMKKILGLSFIKDTSDTYQRKSVIEEKLLLELAPSIGASLSGLGTDILSIKLQPKKHDKAAKLSKLVTAALIFIMVILFCGIGWSRFSQNKAVLEKIEQNIANNKQSISGYLLISSELDNMNKQIKIISDDHANSISSIRILAELSKIIPDDTYLTDIVLTNKSEDNVGNKQLIISGYSRASSNLIEILENSDLFEDVEYIAPIITDVKGERFMIKSLIADDISSVHNKAYGYREQDVEENSVNKAIGKAL
ncbi:MAG: PilN domain-containing protein [Nitrospirae bacterium]|nr:PilN domain-containing protein [Nitrospirota bacterium]